MVRGISKQVIVVDGKNRDFFENAIFILKDESLKKGVCEKDLLRQAKAALTDRPFSGRNAASFQNALWAIGGFSVSGLIWFLTVLL